MNAKNCRKRGLAGKQPTISAEQRPGISPHNTEVYHEDSLPPPTYPSKQRCPNSLYTRPGLWNTALEPHLRRHVWNRALERNVRMALEPRAAPQNR